MGINGFRMRELGLKLDLGLGLEFGLGLELGLGLGLRLGLGVVRVRGCILDPFH